MYLCTIHIFVYTYSCVLAVSTETVMGGGGYEPKCRTTRQMVKQLTELAGGQDKDLEEGLVRICKSVTKNMRLNEWHR